MIQLIKLLFLLLKKINLSIKESASSNFASGIKSSSDKLNDFGVNQSSSISSSNSIPYLNIELISNFNLSSSSEITFGYFSIILNNTSYDTLLSKSSSKSFFSIFFPLKYKVQKNSFFYIIGCGWARSNKENNDLFKLL